MGQVSPWSHVLSALHFKSNKNLYKSALCMHPGSHFCTMLWFEYTLS
jgi:hypothetical protein